MKITNNFFLLCENFLLDDKQRASLINLYDLIWADEFPVTHLALKFVANVKVHDNKSKENISLSVNIIDSKSKSLFKLTTPPIVIKKNTKEQTAGAVFDMQLVTFPAEGEYTAILSCDEEKIATHKIEVKLTQKSKKGN